MQRTFGETVGLADVVECGPHRDDIVACSDGTKCARRDAIMDCEGGYHSIDYDRHEKEVELVSEFFDNVDKWVSEYHTENDDFPAEYGYVVNELCSEWPESVKEWIIDKYCDRFENCLESIVERVCYDLDGGFDCELEYTSADYAGYSGSGCCLHAFDIGECEEQTEIANVPILQVLHEEGRLDDVLDDVRSDACISRSHRREKNEKTGNYNYVGRETYNPYNSEHPYILSYHIPGGQWYFVVPEDRMALAVGDAIAAICRA